MNAAPIAHLSPYELEAMRFGLLEASRREQAQAHLLGCERCRFDEERLREHREHFARQVHPRTVARLRARAESEPGRGLRWAWLAGLMVPAAVVAVLFLRPRSPVVPAPPPTIGIKGAPSLAAVARHGERVFPVTPQVPLAPGDQVRFVLEPGPHRFALVVSVDGGGRASVYHPYQGAESAEVTPNQRQEVPGSIVLDGSPGPERVYVLYSDQPLASGDVAGALQDVGAGGAEAIRAHTTLNVPAAAQSSVLIEKQAP
jgi:hypothetical protein